MKRAYALAFPLLLMATVALGAGDPEEAAIIAVVDRGYVHGVHIDRDPELMRTGMHDSFVMFVQGDKGVTPLTRDAWIERLTAAKAKSAENATPPKMEGKITVLDHSGNAAVAKVDLFRDGKQIFTDYISLYRFAEGWKMVAKTFHRH